MAGRLELDVTGIRRRYEVFLWIRDMEGRPIELEHGVRPDNPPHEWDLLPGAYRAQWESDEGMRYVATVRVEAGRTTTLRLADETTRSEVAPSAELGVLDVRVAVPAGVPASRVWVEAEGLSFGGIDQAQRDTNAEGRCRFHLVPGRYHVLVGPHRVPVEVDGATVATIEIGHRDHGAVLFDQVEATAYRLEPLDEGAPPSRRWVSRNEWDAAHIFVRPGRYDVVQTQTGGRGRRVGAVAVRAGRTVRFDHVLPKGRLEVYVVRRNAQRPPLRSDRARRWWRKPKFKVMATAGDETFRTRTGRVFPRADIVAGREEAWRAVVDSVPAGAYDIRVSAAGWAESQARAQVAENTVQVLVEMAWTGEK